MSEQRQLGSRNINLQNTHMNTNMRAIFALGIALTLFVSLSFVYAEDPKEKAKESKTAKELKDTATEKKTADQTFDGRKVDPQTKVEKSTQPLTADQIAKQENQKEQQRQKKVSEDTKLDQHNVPAPKPKKSP